MSQHRRGRAAPGEHESQITLSGLFQEQLGQEIGTWQSALNMAWMKETRSGSLAREDVWSHSPPANSEFWAKIHASIANCIRRIESNVLRQELPQGQTMAGRQLERSDVTRFLNALKRIQRSTDIKDIQDVRDQYFRLTH